MHAEPAQMSRRDLLGRSAVLAFFAALGTAAAGMIHASNGTRFSRTRSEAERVGWKRRLAAVPE
jgi:hypothetical protein